MNVFQMLPRHANTSSLSPCPIWFAFNRHQLLPADDGDTLDRDATIYLTYEQLDEIAFHCLPWLLPHTHTHTRTLRCFERCICIHPLELLFPCAHRHLSESRHSASLTIKSNSYISEFYSHHSLVLTVTFASSYSPLPSMMRVMHHRCFGHVSPVSLFLLIFWWSFHITLSLEYIFLKHVRDTHLDKLNICFGQRTLFSSFFLQCLCNLFSLLSPSLSLLIARLVDRYSCLAGTSRANNWRGHCLSCLCAVPGAHLHDISRHLSDSLKNLPLLRLPSLRVSVCECEHLELSWTLSLSSHLIFSSFSSLFSPYSPSRYHQATKTCRCWAVSRETITITNLTRDVTSLENAHTWIFLDHLQRFTWTA